MRLSVDRHREVLRGQFRDDTPVSPDDLGLNLDDVNAASESLTTFNCHGECGDQ
jgi:hypothetical protein